MVLTLDGSTDTPSLDRTCPKQLIVALLNSHFDSFRVRPPVLNLFKTSFSARSCSSCDLPCTRISSLMFNAPFKPPISCRIMFWKHSLADEIPKLRRL